MLVRESISFQRGVDPKKVLGIGDYHLIHDWLEKYEINNYSINADMSIDVGRSVDFTNRGHYIYDNLPEYINFNVVDGNFWIYQNGLLSLRGSPKKTTGSFSCSQNSLTSFEYAPEYIGKDFFCYRNNFTSLDFFPKYIGGDLEIDDTFTEEEIRNKCQVQNQIIIKYHR